MKKTSRNNPYRRTWQEYALIAVVVVLSLSALWLNRSINLQNDKNSGGTSLAATIDGLQPGTPESISARTETEAVFEEDMMREIDVFEASASAGTHNAAENISAVYDESNF